MATKIRGYLWTMNYRGFNVYAKKNDVDAWHADPDQNLVNKGLAATEEILYGEGVVDIMKAIDDRWEALASMTEDGYTEHLR